MKGRDATVRMLPVAFLALLVAGALALAACGPGPAEPPAAGSGPGEEEHPLRPHFVSALEELRKMNDQGRAGDFQQAEAHFVAFRTAYGRLADAISEQDAKLRVLIDQGIEELVHEFQKEQPRAFELDEENMKISQLLEKGAALLGVEVPPELVLRRTVEEIPYEHERRVEVSLAEYTVEPVQIEVEVNTRLTLVVTNAGEKVHELEVEHYALELEDLQPGETRELTFVTLDRGQFELACFQPGHYEAGQKALLVVR